MFHIFVRNSYILVSVSVRSENMLPDKHEKFLYLVHVLETNLCHRSNRESSPPSKGPICLQAYQQYFAAQNLKYTIFCRPVRGRELMSDLDPETCVKGEDIGIT
jgi:hypothetical protein